MTPSRRAAAALALLALAVLWHVRPALCAAGADSATIRIQPGRVLGAVNRQLLGNNMLGYQNARTEYGNRGAGIWDPERRRSVPELVTLARQCGLSVSRWPGGCGAHRFLWKRTVGPLAERPKQQFGLPEFLRHCSDIGATPIITLSAYVCPPQDAADMVEYLNAPNDGANPGDGRDWAARRAADGHAEPWKVVWFEFGNESDHGDHAGNRLSPEEYVRKFIAVRRAMRAVDPRVKLGAVLENTSTGKVGRWTRAVLEGAAREIDFAIHHCYLPRYYSDSGKPPPAELIALALAGDAQIDHVYRQLRSHIRTLTGRDDIPLAITEYNGHFVQKRSQPVPYRHCLGNALVNAEILRILMKPEHHVALANHWQFANEYWGSVKNYEPPYVRRPNYHVFQLYHQHLGDLLVRAHVACATYDTSGGYGVLPRAGKPAHLQLFEKNLLPEQRWELTPPGKGASHRVENGVVAVAFDGSADINYHHARKRLPARPATGYRLTGWVKTDALKTAQGACFQIGDGRGWTATRSCAMADSVFGTADWTKLEVDYVTLKDTTALEVMARRLSGAGKESGKAWYRDVEVREFRPHNYGAAPVLTANASRSRDGKTLYVLVVNKNVREAVPCTLAIEGARVAAAQARALVGPAPEATNETVPSNCKVVPLPVTVGDGIASIRFPKHSLTAITLRPATTEE